MPGRDETGGLAKELRIAEYDDIDIPCRSPELPLKSDGGSPINPDIDDNASFFRQRSDLFEGGQNIFHAQNP